MNQHYRTILAPNSPFIGHFCPIKRQPLQPGQEVVICNRSQTGFLVESWLYLHENCPYCATNQAGPAIGVSPEPAALARLVIPGGRSFLLDREVVNIGRGPGNQIILDDIHVSYRHARIRRDGAVFYLFDLGSTNGAWFNDRPVQQLRLEDDDQIRLGNSVLIFKQSSEARLPASVQGKQIKTEPLRPVTS